MKCAKESFRRGNEYFPSERMGSPKEQLSQFPHPWNRDDLRIATEGCKDKVSMYPERFPNRVEHIVSAQ